MWVVLKLIKNDAAAVGQAATESLPDLMLAGGEASSGRLAAQLQCEIGAVLFHRSPIICEL
jgi:hypothetical protein